MVWLPEDTSTWSFPGRSRASTLVSFTSTPVWPLNFDRTSCIGPTSDSARETLNVIVVPARLPFGAGVAFFLPPPPHAAPTSARTATSTTAVFVLYVMHHTSSALRMGPSSIPCVRSSFHGSGQRAGPQVALEEVHDQQDGEGEDGRHGRHLLGRPSVDGLEDLQRQRQLVRGQQSRVEELVPRVQPHEQGGNGDAPRRHGKDHSDQGSEPGRSVDLRRLFQVDGNGFERADQNPGDERQGT